MTASLISMCSKSRYWYSFVYQRCAINTLGLVRACRMLRDIWRFYDSNEHTHTQTHNRTHKRTQNDIYRFYCTCLLKQHTDSHQTIKGPKPLHRLLRATTTSNDNDDNLAARHLNIVVCKAHTHTHTAHRTNRQRFWAFVSVRCDDSRTHGLRTCRNTRFFGDDRRVSAYIMCMGVCVCVYSICVHSRGVISFAKRRGGNGDDRTGFIEIYWVINYALSLCAVQSLACCNSTPQHLRFNVNTHRMCKHACRK